MTAGEFLRLLVQAYSITENWIFGESKVYPASLEQLMVNVKVKNGKNPFAAPS